MLLASFKDHEINYGIGFVFTLILIIVEPKFIKMASDKEWNETKWMEGFISWKVSNSLGMLESSRTYIEISHPNEIGKNLRYQKLTKKEKEKLIAEGYIISYPDVDKEIQSRKETIRSMWIERINRKINTLDMEGVFMHVFDVNGKFLYSQASQLSEDQLKVGIKKGYFVKEVDYKEELKRLKERINTLEKMDVNDIHGLGNS